MVPIVDQMTKKRKQTDIPVNLPGNVTSSHEDIIAKLLDHIFQYFFLYVENVNSPLKQTVIKSKWLISDQTFNCVLLLYIGLK